MDDNIIFGLWLRISHKIGSDMLYWVLMVSGKVVTKTMVQQLIRIDFIDPDMKRLIEEIVG